MKKAVITFPELSSNLVASSSPPASVLAETEGWDIVQAISLDTLNGYLQFSEHGPLTLNYQPEGGAVSLSLQATLGHFSVVPGGSGPNVWLSFPVDQGTITVNQVPVSLEQARIILEVRLAFEPPMPSSPSKESTTHRLLVSHTNATPEVPEVSVLEVIFPPSEDPGKLMESLTAQAFGAWFKENIDSIRDVVFAEVSLNSKPADSQLQWAVPTFASYAYEDAPEGEQGNFAILIRTLNQPVDNLFQTLSSVAVPVAQKGSVLVNPQTVLTYSMLPGISHVFSDAKPSDFTLINNHTELVNRKGTRFKMKPFKIPSGPNAGTTVRPELVSFDLLFRDKEVFLTTEAEVTLFPGIHVFITHKSHLGLTIASKKDGSQTLDYVPISAPEVSHRIEKSDTNIALEVIIPLVLSILGPIGGGLLKEIGDKVALLILMSILKIGTTAIIATIGDTGRDDLPEKLPPLDDLLRTVSQGIKWGGQSTRFDAQKADVNGSIQLGGRLEAKVAPGLNDRLISLANAHIQGKGEYNISEAEAQDLLDNTATEGSQRLKDHRSLKHILGAYRFTEKGRSLIEKRVM